MKQKIYIDHQIYTMQNYGGISRVFTEIFGEFKRGNEVEPYLPILFSDNEYIGEIKKVKSILPTNKSFIKKLFYYAINRLYSTYVLIRGDFDIFQPTYYDPYFLPFLKGKPFVLLVHDMTHEIFPETVSKKDKTIEWKKKLVYKADRILAISESTKKDIIKFYGIDESKIDIVYWGTSLKITKKNFDIDLPKKYILFVGNRGTYKNFELFFKSVSTILRESEDLYLVCAGSSNFSDKEIGMFKEFGVEEKVKHFRFKNDDEFAYIYNKAICFVFPSLYEGFGIPVLEAFACDCPAVISNTSSLPEVGGDAVEYFNPKDMESIKNSIEKVVKNEKLRNDLIMKGRNRLKMFSWEKATQKFINTYREIKL